jgi:hypothetical protein
VEAVKSDAPAEEPKGDTPPEDQKSDVPVEELKSEASLEEPVSDVPVEEPKKDVALEEPGSSEGEDEVAPAPPTGEAVPEEPKSDAAPDVVGEKPKSDDEPEPGLALDEGDAAEVRRRLQKGDVLIVKLGFPNGQSWKFAYRKKAVIRQVREVAAQELAVPVDKIVLTFQGTQLGDATLISQLQVPATRRIKVSILD